LSDGADAVSQYPPPPPGEYSKGAGVRRFGKFEGLVAIVGLAVVWQIGSYFFPNYLFPSVPAISERFLEIFSSLDSTLDALATASRILAGLAGAFILGGALAALMARSPVFERYAYPLLSFNQGIPALSWVVIAIIWFKGIEFRIFFIMVMTTLPGFTLQLLDAYRSISNDLYEMTLSFRPSRYDLMRTLIWPAVLPGILTAWKVNLGNASRVVVVAELVGATGGVGYQLLLQQQVFDMAGAIAWTIVLVIFVLIIQSLISVIETHALRYRAVSERAP
jgi:NitT/TauT family transport system permease protein